MPTNTVSKEASLMRINTPTFLTLTKNPSNRSGFKVLRSDPTPGTMEKEPRQRRVRAKRAEHPGLLAIRLPDTVTSDNVEEYIAKFKLGNEYAAVSTDEGLMLARNGADASNLDSVIAVPFDGCTAYLNPDNVAMRSVGTSKTGGITLLSVEFSKDFGTQEEVDAWGEDHGVSGIAATDSGGYIAVRHQTPEDQEVDTHTVFLSEGVKGVIARTEETDVPEKVYRAIVEAAYGMWGWGSLDFVQAVADKSFCEMSESAIYLLRDTLDNILFYSDLTLDERSVLIQNATSSFSAYITGMLQALPTQAARRHAPSDDAHNSGDETMTKKVEDDKTEGAVNGTADKGADASNQSDAVGRADFDALKTSVDALVSRMDKEDAPADPEGPEDTPADTAEDQGAAKRSDDGSNTDEALSTMAKALESVARSVMELDKKVEGISDNTVVTRGTEADPDPDNGEDDDEDAPKSVFRGMFGRQVQDPRDRV